MRHASKAARSSLAIFGKGKNNMTVIRLLSRIAHWTRDRGVIDQLLARSDRELADIGLFRGDVERAVRYGRHQTKA